MLIRLKCINDKCGYTYDISIDELEEFGQYHKKCFVCGSKLEITAESLKEAIKMELYIKAEEYIDKWFNELGGDETLSLIQRHKNHPCYEIYKDILIKKGFKIVD